MPQRSPAAIFDFFFLAAVPVDLQRSPDRVGVLKALLQSGLASALFRFGAALAFGLRFRRLKQAGIAEYWLIDPERRYVTVYVLPEGAESYEIRAEYTAGQVLTAVTLPEFRLAIEELFQA